MPQPTEHNNHNVGGDMTNTDDNTHIDDDEGAEGECHLSSQHILTFTFAHWLNEIDDDEFQFAMFHSFFAC